MYMFIIQLYHGVRLRKHYELKNLSNVTKEDIVLVYSNYLTAPHPFYVQLP